MKLIGEYTLFIDADDYLEPNMLNNLYNKAKEENSDLVICDYYEVYDNEKRYKIAMKNFSGDNKINYMLSNTSPWNKMIKTEIMKNNNIKFLEHHIYEDMATMPILVGYIDKVSYIQKPLYGYIIRSGSTMRQKTYNKKLESIFVAVDYLVNQFKERGLEKKYKEELEYIIIEHLLYAGSGRFLQYEEGKNKLKEIKKIMKENYPNWKENKYYKKQSSKFKITCNIFYSQNPILIRIYSTMRNK